MRFPVVAQICSMAVLLCSTSTVRATIIAVSHSFTPDLWVTPEHDPFLQGEFRQNKLDYFQP